MIIHAACILFITLLHNILHTYIYIYMYIYVYIYIYICVYPPCTQRWKPNYTKLKVNFAIVRGASPCDLQPLPRRPDFQTHTLLWNLELGCGSPKFIGVIILIIGYKHPKATGSWWCYRLYESLWFIIGPQAMIIIISPLDLPRKGFHMQCSASFSESFTMHPLVRPLAPLCARAQGGPAKAGSDAKQGDARVRWRSWFMRLSRNTINHHLSPLITINHRYYPLMTINKY